MTAKCWWTAKWTRAALDLEVQHTQEFGVIERLVAIGVAFAKAFVDIYSEAAREIVLFADSIQLSLMPEVLGLWGWLLAM